MSIGGADLLQLLHQQPSKILLLPGGGTTGRRRIGLGINGDIAKKALRHRVIECHGNSHRESRAGLSSKKSTPPNPRLAFAWATGSLRQILERLNGVSWTRHSGQMASLSSLAARNATFLDALI